MSKWKELQEQEKAKNDPVQNGDMTLEEVEQAFGDTMDLIKSGFRKRLNDEKQRFSDVCDTNYYFTVCFTTFEQLREFCDSIGQDPMLLYVDGKEFARNINRAIKAPDFQIPTHKPFTKEYTDRALEMDDPYYTHEKDDA